MMRRIDLLPESYAARRRHRRNVATIVIAALVALALLIGWWAVLGGQISSAESELAEVQARNDRLRSQIAELRQFELLEREVETKEQALATVMEGDVAWPVVLTEVAMLVPGEIWFENLTASAGQAEGATQVGTETAPIRDTTRAAFGRIQFQGASLSMSGVGKWLVRLASSGRFTSVYLNSAVRAEVEGATETFDFDSTVELTRRAASDRFAGGRR
ncbi:MAG TPA: PilN domain-containing protein [Actinomycetota bacterium]|nr:PilN domain-containing protein [Actinomycetota bacterium]